MFERLSQDSEETEKAMLYIEINPGLIFRLMLKARITITALYFS